MPNQFDDVEIAVDSFAYRDLIGTDRWVPWVPVRTGWTDSGTPAVTGRFRVVGKCCFFQLRVIPGTTVATTAGTSYIALPITARGIGGSGSLVNITTKVAVGLLVIDVPNSRAYLPSQSATGNTLTLAGWYEI